MAVLARSLHRRGAWIADRTAEIAETAERPGPELLGRLASVLRAIEALNQDLEDLRRTCPARSAAEVERHARAARGQLTRAIDVLRDLARTPAEADGRLPRTGALTPGSARVRRPSGFRTARPGTLGACLRTPSRRAAPIPARRRRSSSWSARWCTTSRSGWSSR